MEAAGASIETPLGRTRLVYRGRPARLTVTWPDGTRETPEWSGGDHAAYLDETQKLPDEVRDCVYTEVFKVDRRGPMPTNERDTVLARFVTALRQIVLPAVGVGHRALGIGKVNEGDPPAPHPQPLAPNPQPPSGWRAAASNWR